jgi:hypothetical protein
MRTYTFALVMLNTIGFVGLGTACAAKLINDSRIEPVQEQIVPSEKQIWASNSQNDPSEGRLCRAGVLTPHFQTAQALLDTKIELFTSSLGKQAAKVALGYAESLWVDYYNKNCVRTVAGKHGLKQLPQPSQT